jgi:hypothetical protein
VPLQREDIDYYRYHPLALNAAFLGNLTPEDQRILGFGNKTNYVPFFDRKPKHDGLQTMQQKVLNAKILGAEFTSRVGARVTRMFR